MKLLHHFYSTIGVRPFGRCSVFEKYKDKLNYGIGERTKKCSICKETYR